MKKLFTSTASKLLIPFFTILTIQAHGQTINIGPNQYAFRFTQNPNIGLFFNAAGQRYEFRNGLANPVFAFDANNGRMTTNIEFNPGSDLLVGANRYAFRSSVAPNVGLFATNNRIQFLNASASPIFSINIADGSWDTDLRFLPGKTLRVANEEFIFKSANDPLKGLLANNLGYAFTGSDGLIQITINPDFGSINTPGIISAGSGSSVLWNMAHSWGNHATAGYLTAETDPKIAALSNQAVPRWNGTQLVGGSVNDNGNNVGIGSTPSLNSKLFVSGTGLSNTPGQRALYSTRLGGSENSAYLSSSWASTNQAAAVAAFNSWGNSYTAAVHGSAFLDYENTAAVIGASQDGATFGALGYRSGGLKAGYFVGNVEVRGAGTSNPNLRIAAGSTGESELDLSVSGLFRSPWRIRNNGSVILFSRSVDQVYGSLIDGLRVGIFSVSPGDNNSVTLGESSLRWTTVFATNGTINTSDAREKKNVEDLRYGLEKVMELRPVSFEWNDQPDEGKKLGLIAQELQQVLPEVVRDWDYEEDESGQRHKVEAQRLGVYYSDIIPVLIKAIQEQQAQIENLEPTKVEALQQELSEVKSHNERLQSTLDQVLERLADLERGLSSCCDGSQQGSSALPFKGYKDTAPWLGQNRPNPFTGSTVIDYFVPARSNATLHITTLSGQLLMQQRLDAQNNQVEISTGQLAPGVYLYSLIMDGELMMSKRMVVQ